MMHHTVEIVRVGNVDIATSMTVAEAARLRELADGARVLEIGSAHGFSTITMALVARSVVAVDPHDGTWDGFDLSNSLEVLEENLWRARVLDKVRVRVARSQDELPLMRRWYKFDLVFVDGDHSYDGCRQDLENALELLAPDGVIAVHDYGETSTPDVPRAVDDVFPRGPDRLTDTLFEISP